jgi:hypothetical protein
MPLAFKKGDVVRQIVTPVEGTVVDVAVIDADVQYCVEFDGTDGEKHQRFFAETQIEVKV